MEQLSSAGFQWADPYTQCVLQNTITAILNECVSEALFRETVTPLHSCSLSFDEAECDLFLPASQRLSGKEISLVGPTDDLNRDDDGDDDVEEEEVVVGEGETPEMFIVPGQNTEGIVSSVVPKKMPALVSPCSPLDLSSPPRNNTHDVLCPRNTVEDQSPGAPTLLLV